MDLTTYTGLQSTIGDYLERDDMAARIPGWIQIAEAQIARDLRRTTKRETTTVFAPTFNLPATVAELRSARLVTASPHRDKPLVNVTVEHLAERRAGRSPTGRPMFFAVRGAEMQFVPAPDQPYTMEYSYYQKLVPLSAANPSNTVLVEAPDLYLFGTLKEAAVFLDDERAVVWEAKYNAALASLERVRVAEESQASVRRGRIPRVF